MLLVESTATAPTLTGNRWRARIIEGNRWGSSGYYPAEVLERDGATTWPQGTAVFFDHPGEQERYDRPERSVRDLAGRIDSTPVYEGDGLYADVLFYEHAAPIVREMAADIGLSIRANGEFEEGERDGRRGRIVTALSEGQSVDLVTKAGCGGRLVSLMESARQSIAEASAEDTRAALSDAVKAAHGGEDGPFVWVRDFAPDASTVTFTVDGGDLTGTYRQGYTDDGATLVGAPVRGRMTTTFVPDTTTTDPVTPQPPVAPAGPSTTPTESKEDTMPNIEESRLAQLEEAAGRVQTLQESLDAATARAEAAEKQLRTATVDRLIAESGATLTRLERAGLMADLPVTESGALDEAALVKTLTEAAAEKQAAAGAGAVTGFGTGPVTESTATDPFATIDALYGLKEA